MDSHKPLQGNTSCLFETPWGQFHEKSQTEPDSRLSQGLKSETFVSAEFLSEMDFTKGGSAKTSLKLWSQLFNLISYIWWVYF